jgi:menaquinone-dependent protoporphyrinogen IX oxidase
VNEVGKRTLIAFATKSGVTGENANIIAGVLRDDFGHEVDVVDLREAKMPDVAGYDNVVIGSGIRAFRWYGKAKKQLRNKALADKKVAVYVSCCTVGHGEGHDKAMAKFVDKQLAKAPHLKPVAKEALGGRMPGNAKADFHDPDKVRAWAAELGAAFGE